jgi:hypothetical protein
MKKTVILFSAILLMLSCSQTSNPTNDISVESITYTMNNGTTGPEYYRVDCYVFTSNDMMNHKQYKWNNNPVSDKSYSLQENTFTNLIDFVEKNSICYLDDTYYAGGIGCPTKKIHIITNSSEKSINWSGLDGALFPKKLLELEKMILDLIP